MVDCLFYFSFVLHFFRFIHFRIYIVQDCEHICPPTSIFTLMSFLLFLINISTL
nr:MAG TPA: hypothetical protein [Herelleviridae sp.]DAP52057.1 MAG TPA: hypothetical protein [Caudoviricetes sp.]